VADNGIFVLISGVLFAYLAYFANFPGFVSFTYANTSPWGNTWLFALLLPIIVIAVGAAIIYYSVRPYTSRPPPSPSS